MIRETILVTGAGGDIGQGIIRCLKDTSAGWKVRLIGCDIDPYAAGRKELDAFFQCPLARDERKYFLFLKELVNTQGINAIFPSSESEIIFFDKHRKYFNAKKTTLFINTSSIIQTFFDKYKTVQFLKRNKLPYPETYLLNRYPDCMKFPLIIKPRKGCGGKGLTRVNDKMELAFFKKRIKDAIIQENIGTAEHEYTVGVFSTGAKTYSIAFKRVLGYGSMTKVASLIQDDSISKLAEKIARLCSLKGSLNIQLRRTKHGYIPLEINPRLSSTVYFRHFFGFRDVWWWIQLAEGKDISYHLKYMSGVAVRSMGEVFLELKKP